MGSRLEPRAPHQRARGESRAGNDVRPADGFRQIAGRHRGHSFRRERFDDRRRPDGVTAPDQRFGNRANGRVGAGEFRRELSGADHQVRGSFCAGQVPGRERRRRRGSAIGQRPSVDRGERRARRAVEQKNARLNRGNSRRRVAGKDVRDLDDDRAVPAPCRLYQHRACRADLVAMAKRRFAAFAKRALEPVDQGRIIEQRLRPSGVDDAHQSAEPGNAVAEARFRPPGARRPVRQRPDIHPIAMPASNPAAADPSNQIAAGISKEPGNGQSVSATGARFSKANTPTTSASGTNSAIPASRFTSRPVFRAARATCRSGGRACPCRP